MEVSSISTVPRYCNLYSSVSEPSRFRGFKVHLWDQSLIRVQLSIRKRRTPRNLISCSQNSDVTVVDGSCMDEIYDKLAERIVPTGAAMFSPNVKRLVGLAGPPGAGKSTLANEVVRRVNKLWPQKASSFDAEVQPPDVAVVLPMDGFHLYRSMQWRIPKKPMQEEEVRSARIIFYVRLPADKTLLLSIEPAPWTFDPALFLNCLKKLRDEGSVYVPSFDHGVGDPVENNIFISLQHKVVIVEGNYILLEDGSWKDVSEMFDEKWFIDVNLDTAMQRVELRHISTGKPPDVAKWRVDYNDRPNAELIIKSKTNADLLIRSINY